MFRTFLLFICLSLGMLVTACNEDEETVKQQEIIQRSAEEVIAVAAEQGLTVQQGKAEPENVFQMELSGREPLVLVLDDKPLVLYQFASTEEREAGWTEFGERTAAADLIPFNHYREESLLLFYIHGLHGVDEGLHTKLQAVLKALSVKADRE